MSDLLARMARRWVPRILDGLLVLVIYLAVGGPFRLERPWLKARVQSYVRSSFGVEVDFASARVSLLRGIEVDDLLVRSAPDELRARHATARWSPSSLTGRGPPVERIDLSEAALSIVFDDLDGAGWRALLSSRRPTELLSSAPPVSRLDASRATVTLRWTRGARVIESDEIRGLDVAAAAAPDANAWRVHAAVGTTDVEIRREVEGSPASDARARLSLAADLTTTALTLSSDASVSAQSLVPRVGPGDWHVRAAAHFEPGARRTIIELEDGRGAGAVSAEGTLVLPDEGEPILRHAEGNIDVPRVLAWLPPGLVPVAAEHATLRYRVDAVILAPTPRLAEGGAFHLEAEVTKAKLRAPEMVIEVERAELALDGRSNGSAGLTLEGAQRLDGLRAELAQSEVAASDVSLDVKGERGRDGTLSARMSGRFARLRYEESGVAVALRDGHGEAMLGGPEVTVSAEASTIDARGLGARIVAGPAALERRGDDVEVNATNVKLLTGGEHPWTTRQARVAVHLRAPARLHASIDLEQGRASVSAVEHGDTIDYDLDARARSLEPIRRYLPAGLEASSVALRSKGRLSRKGRAPVLEQNTSIEVEDAALRGLSAPSLLVGLWARGTLAHQETVATIHARGLAAGGLPAIDHSAAISAVVDRDPFWAVQLDAGVEGYVRARVAGSVSYEDGAFVFDLDGLASHLAPIAPLAVGFDLSRSELGLTTRGRLSGVVSRLEPDGEIALEQNPWRTAAIEGTVDLHVANLRWARRDLAIAMPSFRWHGALEAEGARRTVQGHAEVDTVRLMLGGHEVDLAGLSDDARVSVTGDLRNPTIDVEQRGTIRVVDQDYVPEYPVGDVSLALTAGRGRDGVIRVGSVRLRNGNGGTSLDLAGSLDPEGRRKRLAMTATLTQDLARVSVRPDRFSGNGQVEIKATVESPNLALFRMQADVKVERARVRSPAVGLEIDAIEGAVPIRMVLDADRGRFSLRRNVAPSPFARLGLADRHPLLGRRDFLSIGRLKTPRVSIAPLIGKLSVDQNVIALEQFEMGVRGGWLTGDCVFDWAGLESKLEAHLRANGVQSSHGEPLDGNISVVVAARDRMIEGRAEIARMGPRHLLDLLDLEDPLHVDAATNRVRSALDWGHPKRLSVVFDNGFANAHVELGGLASFIRLADLRGLPTGPLVDRLVEAALDGKAAP